MSAELWKPVNGFSKYYISNKGRIFSEYRNKLITPVIRKDGYVIITMNKDRKQYNKFVHRLVAEAFIPNPYNYPQINHKDEVKTNNNAKNLEWCTLQYNVSYGKKLFMLKKWKAIWKCDRYTHEKIEKFHCICAAAQELGNLQWSKHIGDVLKGRRKSAYGFWWCYAETEMAK